MKRKVILQIIKYICFILYAFALPGLRWKIALLFIAFMVYDIVRKYKFIILQDIIIRAALFLITLTHYPLFKQVDYLRFTMLKNAYDSAANRIVSELKEEENEYWTAYHTNGLSFISVNSNVYYMKYDDSVAVLFLTDKASITGYVYYAGPVAPEMVKTPSKYWPEYTAVDDIYEFYRQFSDEWSYIHFY